MNGSTIIFGAAGIMLLLVSLYELIADKALLNRTIYDKYTKQSADRYVRQEGFWGVLISVGALLLALSYWKDVGRILVVCAAVLILLGILMTFLASKKLEDK